MADDLGRLQALFLDGFLDGTIADPRADMHSCHVYGRPASAIVAWNMDALNDELALSARRRVECVSRRDRRGREAGA